MNNSEDTQTLLHTIIQEIREIKQKVDALEERIIWMEDNWDNNTQEKTTQSPTNQTDEMETESTPKPTGNPQAHTPAQATQSTIVSQVRSEQNAIHSSLEKLENAMHTMASSIGISINGHNTTNNHY
jgi:DNA-nicking Smr family endonuclease